ncbi:SEC-C metal-binding domain-containing protein [Psychrobacillus sp. NPDC093180]|uniref:IS1096 element passenger TnpR family protein n=1 Tax=Psychrobacillus sp. NPDC093180 TaxID=3364489 RepID=UPI00381050C7
MKAYILKLTFEYLEPSVWRRVILPAGATFNRLHETIQYVTNFKSTISPYHFFGIGIDDIFITNNGAILEEYKGKKFAGQTVKQPTRIKIDSYLEKHGQFVYSYDFGDDWRIRVELEDTVEDYYFGYPTLLDGEGTAPPEDVGGPPGYEEFLKVYHDPTHPDYLRTYAWAEGMYYLPLDIDWVNELLKSVKYKKTEWQHIDHDNYFILSDKYRGADFTDLETLPNKDLVIQYAAACAQLYGVINYSKFVEIYNAQNKIPISSKELHELLTDYHYSKLLEGKYVHVSYNKLVHEAIEGFGDYDALMSKVKGKPYYIPSKKELLRYADEFYFEKTIHQKKLASMVAKDYFGGSTVKAHKEIEELVYELQVFDINVQEALKEFLGRFEFVDKKRLNEYVQAVSMIANTTRIWENRGHTPDELSQMSKPQLKPLPNTFEPTDVVEDVKVGRNDPCPCGSGKKYKKCCGK